MNIYEAARKYKIRLEVLRKMEKRGLLVVDPEGETISTQIRLCLSRGQPMTVEFIVALVENRRIYWELGRYGDVAKKRIAALGDLKNEIAPPDVIAEIRGAARGNQHSLRTLINWLKIILPAKPVGHPYPAVRIALGMPEASRGDIRSLARIMMLCRKDPSFAGWFSIEKIGSRNRSIYQRPLMLHDL